MEKILITSLKCNKTGVPLYTKVVAKHLCEKYRVSILTGKETGVFNELVQQKNINIINTNVNNSFSLNNFFRTYLILKKILSDNYKVIILQGSLFGFVGRLFRKKNIIYVVHGLSFIESDFFWKKNLLLIIEYILSYRKGVKIISLTSQNKNYLNSIGHSNVQTIHNFCRIKPPEVIVESFRKKNTILWVGRNSEEKDSAYLFKLFNRLDEKYKLTIVGTGTDSINFFNIAKNILSRKKIKQVKFLGEVTNIEDEYLKNELFIQTSHYEGFSLAATEARAFNMKLALSKTSGTEEILENYCNSFIITKDLNKDVKKMNELSKQKSKLYDYSFRNKFSKEKFLNNFSKLINSL